MKSSLQEPLPPPPILLEGTGAAPVQEGEYKNTSLPQWFLGLSQTLGEIERSCDSAVSISFLGNLTATDRQSECISSLNLNSVLINCSKCQIHKKILGKLGEKNNNVSCVYSYFVMNRSVDCRRSINSICYYN